RYTFEKLMNLEKFISRNPDNVNRSIELINDTAEIIYDEFMENYTPDGRFWPSLNEQGHQSES
ncbi:MAG: hypothetical protein QGG76_05430, partial [Candidatus Thalassarchaeaceae archaeon]|nr:hypothetical protein [Candidatus Thalassarchaeaceae archaeon]